LSCRSALVMPDLYGCLPDSKEKLCCFAKKSRLLTYIRPCVRGPSGCPGSPAGPDAYSLANPSSWSRTFYVRSGIQV